MLETLLFEYVSTRIHPNIAELQEYLQETSLDRKYNLLVKVTVWHGTALHTAAILGHTDIINCILDCFPVEKRHDLLKIPASLGFTPIHWAAYNGHTAALSSMLDQVLPEHQIRLLNMKTESNRSVRNLAVCFNNPETAALIHQYLETAKEILMERQEENYNPNNAAFQRVLKRHLDALEEEVPRLKRKQEEQQVLIQQKDELIAALAAVVKGHTVQMQEANHKVSALEQQLHEMKGQMDEMKEEVSWMKQEKEEFSHKVDDEIPKLEATTQRHGTELQQHNQRLSVLEVHGAEQKSQIKANTEEIFKNKCQILQQGSQFQEKPNSKPEVPEDGCQSPKIVENVTSPTTDAVVPEEDADSPMHMLDE